MKISASIYIILALVFLPALSSAQTQNSGSQTGAVVGGAIGAYAGSQIINNRLLGAFLGGLGGSFLGSLLGGLGSTGTGSGASSGGAKNTFGGKINWMYPCTCSPGYMLVSIGPPKGGTFILSPSSKLHANMKPVPGSWVIGDYAPNFGQGCYMYAGVTCYVYPTQGFISRIGTS